MTGHRLVVATVLVTAACSLRPAPLATVGEQRVTAEDLAAYVKAQTGRTITESSPELTAAMFENLLEEEVVLAASPDPGDRELPPSQREGRIRQLLIDLCPPPIPPDQAAIEAYLRQHPDEQSGEERLLVRQLVLADEPTARTARARIAQGQDFVAVSKELSRAPNAQDGGMLGWITRGQLPPQFEAAIFPLATGDVSQPVQSNAGWHVFQVIDRRRPGGPPDPAVRERVRAKLAAAAAEKVRHTCVLALASRVGVKVNCAGVTFPCHNPFEVRQ